jgi:hypothetical protein
MSRSQSLPQSGSLDSEKFDLGEELLSLRIMVGEIQDRMAKTHEKNDEQYRLDMVRLRKAECNLRELVRIYGHASHPIPALKSSRQPPTGSLPVILSFLIEKADKRHYRVVINGAKPFLVPLLEGDVLKILAQFPGQASGGDLPADGLLDFKSRDYLIAEAEKTGPKCTGHAMVLRILRLRDILEKNHHCRWFIEGRGSSYRLRIRRAASSAPVPSSGGGPAPI